MLQIRAEQLAWQPWHNGGGRTREMLAQPIGADWKLRVSLAEIEADGDFSAFPGVERWFAVVHGAGVVLRLPGGDCRVCRGDPPVRFDGATAPGCVLLDGPTRDLNLMVRDGTGAMRQVRADEAWNEHFDERGLFTVSPGSIYLHPAASSESNRQDHGRRLEGYTLLWDLGESPCRFVPDGHGVCAWWLGYSGNDA